MRLSFDFNSFRIGLTRNNRFLLYVRLKVVDALFYQWSGSLWWSAVKKTRHSLDLTSTGLVTDSRTYRNVRNGPAA
jgi:hypothetical protein